MLSLVPEARVGVPSRIAPRRLDSPGVPPALAWKESALPMPGAPGWPAVAPFSNPGRAKGCLPESAKGGPASSRCQRWSVCSSAWFGAKDGSPVSAETTATAEQRRRTERRKGTMGRWQKGGTLARCRLRKMRWTGSGAAAAEQAEGAEGSEQRGGGLGNDGQVVQRAQGPGSPDVRVDTDRGAVDGGVQSGACRDQRAGAIGLVVAQLVGRRIEAGHEKPVVGPRLRSAG